MEPKVLLIEAGQPDFSEPTIAAVIELPDVEPTEHDSLLLLVASLPVAILTNHKLQDFCEHWRDYAERNGLPFEWDDSFLGFKDGRWQIVDETMFEEVEA